MDSAILKAVHLEMVDPMLFILGLLVVCMLLFVMLLVTNSKLKKLTKRYEAFMHGKDLESMEELVLTRFQQMDKMLEDTEKNTVDIQQILEGLKSTVQKTGIVKYDAFHEMGGKLSFAIAMLDGNNNGFVMNAMHSREGCYTYVKEIIDGKSYIPLGNEEQDALNQALDILPES